MTLRWFSARNSGYLPLTLRMMLVNEGVKTGIYAGERVLSHAELTSTNITDSLPSPLAEFLHLNINIPDHIYVLAWPDAKNLYDRLKAQASPRLILQCDSVANLITIERPKNFAIQWIYDATHKCLERHLFNAERYLGKGWFQQDRYVWQLDNALPEMMLKWIGTYQIPDRDVFWFVSHFIPAYQHWPISSNLSILNNFTLRLGILNTIERSIEVQLVGNIAGVAERLQYLDGDSENMISRTLLLPNLRPVMSDKILQLAHSRTPMQITADDLPAFIQDDLRPHAAQLGVDMGAIDRKYPIVEAKTLPLEWKLEHKITQGIGQYFAIPHLGDFRLSTAIDKRFYSGNKGWIEFSADVTRKLDGISEFQLNPREILGFPSSRLKLARVQFPHIEQSRGEQVAGFIGTLKINGLPGGFSGFQAEAGDILAAECQHILKDDPAANILWVVPQKKRAAVANALQRVRLSYTNAEDPPSQGKHVTLLSPGANVELPRNWTLIIFQDLDIVALSDIQIHFYSQLNRNWTLATFATDKWFEDTRLIPQVMLALQLVPENLPAFREKCFQSYPDRVTSSRPKLIPPFKVSTSADTHPAIRVAPPVTKLPVEPPILPESTPPPASTPTQPQKQSFVVQAQRYVNRMEPETASVPFAQYWPTYDAMTDAQQKWYFYWRSQVRQGNYLPADLSYLFVYVYEVINMVGFASPQSAFDSLITFWQQYHASQPKLDCYLVDWLADFAAIYKLKLTPLGWYNQVRQQGATFGDFDLFIEAWVQAGGHFIDLPSKFVYRLADYSPTNTKFYQEFKQRNDLDLAYKKGIQAVDDYMRLHGKSLIETYRPAQIRAIVREPFAGARYELDRKPVFIANADTWSANLMLPQNLAAIIKYTENVLRTQANFKTMLLGAEIPKDWEFVIDKAFAPHREIEINTAKVRLLKRESDEIRQRLIVDEPPESANVPLSQLAQVTAIMNDSHSVGTKLLRVLREHNWIADESALDTVMEQGHSFNSELDYLNRQAVKELGDGLIVATNGQYMVAQDYRDEIEYVLDHAEHDQDKVSSTMSVIPSNEYSELTAEWAKFARQMKAHHWEALTVLLGTVDINAQLASIARSVYSTASRLIDDINTFALDSIGDIVISTEGGTPHIEDEDIEGLQILLAWANGKALLENQL